MLLFMVTKVVGLISIKKQNILNRVKEVIKSWNENNLLKPILISCKSIKVLIKMKENSELNRR